MKDQCLFHAMAKYFVENTGLDAKYFFWQIGARSRSCRIRCLKLTMISGNVNQSESRILYLITI